MNYPTRSSLAATLLTVPFVLATAAASPGVTFAQSAEVPTTRADTSEDAALVQTASESGPSPYYGPGWGGPINRAPMGECPAWYSPHTACAVHTSAPEGN
jgi:hypothetical protein